MITFILFFFLKPVTIDVQPMGNMSKQEIGYVFSELKKVYPYIVLKPSINIPQLAYYKPRNRYKADKLIQYLSTTTQNDHVTIGITSKDISTANGSIPDWGVMGLSYMPGKACVVSDYRLSKTDRYNELFKVAIHELGHTQGLHHCPFKTCFMRDAKGKNTTGDEKEFCNKCKSFLVTRGWRF